MRVRVVLLRRSFLAGLLVAAGGVGVAIWLVTAGGGPWPPGLPLPVRPAVTDGAPLPPPSARTTVVMIDPGHGGVDGGAGAAGMLEKEITLDVALRLRQHLTALGVAAHLTRSDDTDLGGGADAPRGRHRRDLQERARRARESGATLLVSLHVNSARTPSEEGMLFFYQHDRPDGRALAQLLYRALLPLQPRREPPIGRRNLYVLRESGIPAVLIELGFITNVADRARLADPGYRDRVALAIALAIALRAPGAGGQG